MKDYYKIIKLQLADYKYPLIIYYSIIFIATIIAVSLNHIIFTINDSGNFGGVTAVFLFICGLNSFKTNFHFSLALNSTRKQFLIGSVIAFCMIALGCAFIDSILNQICQRIVAYEGLYETFYNESNFLRDFIWSFSFYNLFLCIGLFITMLYYKCGNLMKVLISTTPIIIFILTAYLDAISNRSFTQTIKSLIRLILGINTSSYIGSFTILLSIGLITYINHLLIRRMTIRE